MGIGRVIDMVEDRRWDVTWRESGKLCCTAATKGDMISWDFRRHSGTGWKMDVTR